MPVNAVGNRSRAMSAAAIEATTPIVLLTTTIALGSVPVNVPVIALSIAHKSVAPTTAMTPIVAPRSVPCEVRSTIAPSVISAAAPITRAPACSRKMHVAIAIVNVDSIASASDALSAPVCAMPHASAAGASIAPSTPLTAIRRKAGGVIPRSRLSGCIPGRVASAAPMYRRTAVLHGPRCAPKRAISGAVAPNASADAIAKRAPLTIGDMLCVMFSAASELLDAVRAYAPSDARERSMRDRLAAFVAEYGMRAFDRATRTGHVTASAWIVDPERTHAVLLHHRKLDRWLQLGGHVDGDPDVRRSALREAREESGLRTLRMISDDVYDIDVHRIPARPDEPEHDHYDVRFALEADPREPLRGNAESHDVRWVSLDDLERYAIDDSVRRLAAKTAALPPASS
jgi:8-oxo-dGTP pyrophosphatase MutT (NUDIX family)